MADRIQFSLRPIDLPYGLAVENLVKGLLIAQDVVPTSTAHLNPRLKSHNLVQLFQDAGISPTSEEEELLRTLKWAVEAGKYPIGTKPSFFEPKMRIADLDHISRLLERLKQEIRKLSLDKQLSAEEAYRLVISSRLNEPSA